MAQRPQVADPNAGGVSLRPSASPVSTFVSPQAPGNLYFDSAIGGLAESLKGLEPSINTYFEKRQELADQQEEGEALKAIAGLTPDQISEGLKAGKLSYSGAAANAAVQKQYGMRLALQRENQFNEAVLNGEFDLTTGNVDEWIGQAQQQDAELLQDPMAVAGYYQFGAQSFAQIKSKTVEVKAAKLHDDKITGFGELLGKGIQDAMAKEVDPVTIAGMVRKNQVDYATGPMRLDYKETDAQIFEMAKALASGAKSDYDVSVIDALLNMERVDEKGNKLPALSAKASLKADAITLMSNAQNNSLRVQQEAHNGQLMELSDRADNGALGGKDFEAVKGLVERGIFNPSTYITLRNQNQGAIDRRVKEAETARTEQMKAMEPGIFAANAASTLLSGGQINEQQGPVSGKTFTVNTQLQDAYTLLFNRATTVGKMDEDQAAAQVMAIFTKAGYEVPGSKDAINRGIIASQPSNFEVKEVDIGGRIEKRVTITEAPQGSKAGLKEYRRIRGLAPGALRSVYNLTDDQLVFYDAVDIATKVGKMDDDTALMLVTQNMGDNLMNPSKYLKSFSDEEIKKKVDDVSDQWGLDNWINKGDVKDRLVRTASAYKAYLPMLDDNAALDYAAEKMGMEEFTVTIDGGKIALPSGSIPQDARAGYDLLNSQVQENLSAQSEGELDPDDIILYTPPQMPGRFMPMRKVGDHLEPILSAEAFKTYSFADLKEAAAADEELKGELFKKEGEDLSKQLASMEAEIKEEAKVRYQFYKASANNIGRKDAYLQRMAIAEAQNEVLIKYRAGKVAGLVKRGVLSAVDTAAAIPGQLDASRAEFKGAVDPYVVAGLKRTSKAVKTIYHWMADDALIDRLNKETFGPLTQ